MTYQLVREAVSTDTVGALEQLLDDARSGHIIGIAFAAVLKRKRYFVDAAGEARRDPTFTRGMIGALDDELRDLIQGRAQSDTTL